MQAARAKVKCVTTTAVLLAGLLFPTISSADELGSTQQQYQQLQQNTQQQQQKVAQLKSQETTIGNQISGIENQIVITNNQISDLEQQIAEKDKEINQLKSKIDQTENLLQQRDDLLKSRIKVMYENGTTSYLDVILSSTSFSDFIDRLSTLSIIADQDKKILEEIKKQKAILQQQQANLIQAQQQSQQAKTQLLAMRQLQDQQKQQKQAALVQVRSEREAEEKELQAEQSALDQVASQIQSLLQARTASQTQESGSDNTQQYGNGAFIWPVPGYNTVSSGYGWRDLGGQRDFHAGLDIPAPLGTKIVAAADGEVLFSGSASGFGHWIVILHSNGIMSVYGHMYGNGLYVSVGQKVKAGQVIAAVGSDGQSTGPHLHFAVANGITNGRMDYLNPWNYLK